MQLPDPAEPCDLTEKFHEIPRFSSTVNSVRERAGLLGLLAREAAPLMGAERASIFLLDSDRHELWSTVAVGSDKILRFNAHLGLAGAVVRTEKLIRVDDVRSDPRFYPDIDIQTGYHTRSLLAAPLMNPQGELLGVFEVLNKVGGPFTPRDEELLTALAAQAAVAVDTATIVEQLRRHRDDLLRENAHLWQEVKDKFSSPFLLGSSAPIQAILRSIDQIKDSPVTVLITGESGTGKELVAKAIHYSGSRGRHQFVSLNCAALPEALVESELFGIERGVATGVEPRRGHFEAAEGGTLFLDEVGDFSQSTQAKLLRVLQERVIERVGGRKPIPVNARIIAATNKDLVAECRSGNFRHDLYYRLNVIQLHLPPLRERPEDVLPLASYFLFKYCREMKKDPMHLALDALRCLMHYDWPGNVRELENEITRLVVSAQGATIAAADLSHIIRRSGSAASSPAPGFSLKQAVAELEKRLIGEALERCERNQQRAAKALRISRQGLINKMKRYGLKV
jgi:transcriptional regulator with GAF, ATPase, and Fis domain